MVMRSLKLAIAYAAGALISLLPLWALIASVCSEPRRYLGFIRAGLLLVGLFGAAWGMLLQRIRTVVLSVILLALGLATFFIRGD